MHNTLRLVISVVSCAMLGACSDSSDDKDIVDFDPATIRALNDRLMVDPDLVNQNESNAALRVQDDQSLPPIVRHDATIRAAQEKAIALLGGSSEKRPLPEPKKGEPLPVQAKLTAAALANALGHSRCADSLEYSYIWAARLPEEIPVYPLGNTKEAAGIDGKNCELTIVSFVTPVSLEDVLGFYFSRAVAIGYAPEFSEHDGEFRIGGTKDKMRLNVLGRRLSSDLTEIDLVIAG